MYYKDKLYGIHNCNICGSIIKNESAWIYEEGNRFLHFCGDRPDCRDIFLEINKIERCSKE